MENKYVSDFLKYDLQDEYFNDCFSEFICCLTEVDLSQKTIDWLYDIFMKDTRIYFGI